MADVYVSDYNAADEVPTTRIEELLLALKNRIEEVTGSLNETFYFKVVDNVPTAGVEGTIYFVQKKVKGKINYDEYIWANGVLREVDLNFGKTYEFSRDGNTLKATDSDGVVQNVELPIQKNTTYTLGLNGSSVTLTDNIGNVQSVDLPSLEDTNTTYTLGIDGTSITLTDNAGTKQSVSLDSLFSAALAKEY